MRLSRHLAVPDAPGSAEQIEKAENAAANGKKQEEGEDSQQTRQGSSANMLDAHDDKDIIF